jgi:hypothetical protein
MSIDWDTAFNNMNHVAGSHALPAHWAAGAAAYRDSGVSIETDIPYGESEREKFDVVWPDGTPKGLAVFIHGGFWMRLDKSYWTDLAEGARANGWAVCLPSYTLAPEARLSHMTKQMGAAISAAAARVAGPIHISGHSAGGHLATRLICQDSPLSNDVSTRIGHTLSISGLHDLRPLMLTKMNETLNLDETEALKESACLLRPKRPSPLTCWVGGGELTEFIRQSKIMASMWEGLDTPISCYIDDNHNHFTVIEGLRDPNSNIIRNLLGMATNL